jgi:hypothetical protein
MARFYGSAWVAGLAVCGLMGCSAKASPFKSVVLCDFERMPDAVSENPHYDIPTALKKPNYTNHDFRWNTSGYAEMRPVTKDEAKAAKNKPLYKFFQGKSAAQVRFSVPGDYKKITADNKPKSWETGMSLATDSYTPLKVTDWSPYRYLAFSVYNPGDKDQVLHVRFTDSASATSETSATAPAGMPATVEVDLALLAEARVNSKDMRGLTLFLDTAGQAKDPVLIVDNIGLHTATFEARKKAEVEEEAATDEEADWDSEEQEEGKVETGLVSRPGGLSGNAPVSGTAAP